MFSVATILEQLPSEGSLEIKTLEKILKTTKKIDRNRLEIALKALNKLKLIGIEKGTYLTKGNLGNYIVTTIRCSSKGYCFAVRNDGEEDIYIREKNLNHAWHGDQALVEVNKEAVRRRSPEGTVICILERAKTNILASLTYKDDITFAMPLDERIQGKIELKQTDKKYFEKPSNNKIVDIKILRYPLAQLDAIGEIIREHSLNQGLKGDIELLKTKYNIKEDVKPPQVALKQIDSKSRKNLEDQDCLILTSGNFNNSHVLPAIYAQPENGLIRIWIHIPTVAERVNVSSKLDEWIKQRSKSIYLSTHWRSILSEKLLDQSRFNKGSTNKAITLELVINKDGSYKHWEFYLSNIKPKEIITRGQLDLIVNRKSRSRVLPSDIKHLKGYLNTIDDILFVTKAMSNYLGNCGIIQFEDISPEINQLAALYSNYPGKDFYGWGTKLTIEDPLSILTILCKYANKILNLHFDSLKIENIKLSRVTEQNTQSNEILRSAIALDNKIELNDEGVLGFVDLLESIKDSPNKRLIEKLMKNSINDYSYQLSQATNSEKRNNYSESPWTAPSANYADIINQYILIKLLTEGKKKPQTADSQNDLGLLQEEEIDWDIFTKSQLNYINKLCTQTNIRTLNNKRNQSVAFTEGLINMLQLREVEKFIGKSVIGTITGVQSYGFFVELESTLAEGLVHVSSLNDDWYEYRSRQSLLIGRKSKKTFQIGNKVNVIVEKIDLLRNQIDLNIEEMNSLQSQKLPDEDLKIIQEESN